MLTLAVLLAVAPQAWPENPSVDYSGIPTISGGNTSITSHNVTLELYADKVMVGSTTLIKNHGAAGAVTISVPRNRIGDARSGHSTFNIAGTWVNQPIRLVENPATSSAVAAGKMTSYTSALTARASMKAGGSYALRLNYTVPFGKAGFDRKQLLAAYDLTSSAPIGVMMCSYRYAPRTVFRLPEAHPSNLNWQIGEKGVFVRMQNYSGNAGISSVAFYPGGFKNIGDGR